MANRTLQDISVNEIFPNPHNPRLIFDPGDLEDLKESIRKAGVLVPVTVYENDDQNSKEKYILLDGERRWRCAKELNLAVVPANILDKPKDVTQNILYMFNIHYFRKQWELFPTALKLEKIIGLLGTDKDSVLSSTTGLNLTTVKRCKILLWYPEKYRDTLLYKRDKISTDFFIELFPIAKRVKEDPDFNSDHKITMIIDGVMEKFMKGEAFSDVKEFREMRKALSFYDKKDQFVEFKHLLLKFIEDGGAKMDVFMVSDIETEKLKSNAVKHISYLISAFTENPPETFSDISMVDQITALKEKIEQLLLKID
jgi:ParB family transcriptional regulator, chromosome partitioning protein